MTQFRYINVGLQEYHHKGRHKKITGPSQDSILG